MDNIVGKVPEFTQDEAPVEQVPAEETVETVKTDEPVASQSQQVHQEETTPAEPPPVETPLPENKQLQGLINERERLLDEIKALRGTKRELKQGEIEKVTQQITDELKDVNPEDVSVVEKILRAKGFVTKQEAHQMYYNAKKNEEVNKFLEKYPEYKPENDANDLNWSALQRELKYYREPEDPNEITQVLERAHKAIAKPRVQNFQAKRQQVAVAGHGAGGVQRPSAPAREGRITPEMKTVLLQGGWSEDEIKNY